MIGTLDWQGNILNAVVQIYDKVECSVQLKHMNANSEWFSVNTGLKQGCLVSSLAFSLYINDLVGKLNSTGIGIKMGNDKLTCLLYADDLVIFANTARELQTLTDQLREWCFENYVTVNTEKSQAVHFHHKTKKKSSFVFKYENEALKTVSSYKYLGVLLHEHLDYNVTA